MYALLFNAVRPTMGLGCFKPGPVIPGAGFEFILKNGFTTKPVFGNDEGAGKFNEEEEEGILAVIMGGAVFGVSCGFVKAKLLVFVLFTFCIEYGRNNGRLTVAIVVGFIVEVGMEDTTEGVLFIDTEEVGTVDATDKGCVVTVLIVGTNEGINRVDVDCGTVKGTGEV